MGWHYIFLLNTMSAVALSGIHILNNGAPWYLTVILFLNIILLSVSSLVIDDKNSKRDERIEQLEKELTELRNTCLDYWASNGYYFCYDIIYKK